MAYTPRQIEKYNRQKYITYIEKIKKNLFSSFRNTSTDAKSLKQKMSELMNGLEKLEKIRLDTEYMRESEKYIKEVYEYIMRDDFDNDRMNDIRDKQLGILNRLQKMRNKSRYKKDKHAHKKSTEGWE